MLHVTLDLDFFRLLCVYTLRRTQEVEASTNLYLTYIGSFLSLGMQEYVLILLFVSRSEPVLTIGGPSFCIFTVVKILIFHLN